MSQGKWEKIAERQFKQMPKSFQKDWAELCNIINKRH